MRILRFMLLPVIEWTRISRLERLQIMVELRLRRFALSMQDERQSTIIILVFNAYTFV